MSKPQWIQAIKAMLREGIDWATEVFPVIAKNAAGRPTMRLHRGRTVKGDDITVIVLAGPLWSSGVLAWPLFKELRAQHPDAYAAVVALTKTKV